MVPLLQEIGRAWQSGRLAPSAEHLASVAIRRFLEWVAETNTSGASAPLAVTGTPSGQRHEFGALLAGVIAGYEGWRVRFLGPELPPGEIARAAQQLGATMVALSAVHPRLDAAGVQDMIELRQMLPSNVRLVVGGAAADPHRDRWRESGILSFDSLAAFRESLGVSTDAN
jgi:methanogenic corrinoid protein MtbC1